jgi:hypothetical protein
LRVVVLLAFVCGLAPVAGARTETPARGKVHLERGLQLYRDGLYQQAIAEFESGYAALPRPAFLLNIAQAYRKLNQLERARSYYQQFAAKTTRSDPARAQVLAIVDKIDQQLRAQAAEAAHAPPATREPDTTPPPATTAPPLATTPPATPPTTGTVASPFEAPPASEAPLAPPSRTPGWAGVGLLAGGVAVLGAGLGLTLESLQLQDRYLHPSGGTVFNPNLLEQRDLFRNLGVGFLAGGGALVVVGVALAVRYLPASHGVHAAHVVRVGLAPRFEATF